jgi:hypothetical protein
MVSPQDSPILLKSAFSSWPFSDAADAWHLLLEAEKLDAFLSFFDIKAWFRWLNPLKVTVSYFVT